jgi:hypothetical protein
MSLLRTVLALVAATLVSNANAVGLGASDRGFLDGGSIDAQGNVTLLLVVDRPLEDGLTKQRVRSKILGYKTWLDDPKFKDRYPQAKLDLGRTLLIAHPKARNALGEAVLAQCVAYAAELGFKTKTKELPPPSAAK